MTTQEPPTTLATTAPPRPGPSELAHALGYTNVEQLADRIQVNGHGVSGRTLYKWFKRGAPFDSEGALRSWITNQGMPVAPALPTLATAMGEVLGQSLAQHAPTLPAGQEVGAAATEPKVTNPDGTALSPAQEAALARRDRDAVQTEKAELELSILKKEHLHQDRAAAALQELAQDVIAGLTDLVPRTLRAVPSTLDADLRQQVREALQRETLHLRNQIITRAPELLKRALGMEGATP